MSAVLFVVAFACCALLIRGLGVREQAPRPRPAVIEAEDARR